MAARTRVHACFLSKSAEKENMGSFWSSSSTEPVENQQPSLQRNEHGRKVQINLQTSKSVKQAGVPNALASKTNTIRAPQHPGSLGQKSARKVKSSPGWSFRCTTKTYKLPGTPRPQFPPRGAAGPSHMAVGREMVSKRHVIIANQSSDPRVGAGKDTEIVGVFRKGTPHPKRKRVSICSNVFRAGGDTGESNSSPAEISNISTCSTQTENSPKEEDKVETRVQATSSRILDFSPDLPRPSTRRGALEDSHIQSEPESDLNIISNENSITISVDEGNDSKCDKFVSPEVLDAKSKCEIEVQSSSPAGDAKASEKPCETQGKEHMREIVCTVKQEPESSRLLPPPAAAAEKRKRKIRSASPGRNAPKRQCRLLRELKDSAPAPAHRRPAHK